MGIMKEINMEICEEIEDKLCEELGIEKCQRTYELASKLFDAMVKGLTSHGFDV